MISLKLAKKLKEAGLKWEPKMGDIFVCDYKNGLGPTKPKVINNVDNFGQPGWEHIWLPRLDQLLGEIEKRGYKPASQYTIHKQTRDNNGQYNCTLGVCQGIFYANTREDAAAKVLLWVLEQEEKHKEINYNGGASDG